MMNNTELANKALAIAKNYKTSYMLGAFGWPATESNINRLLQQYYDNHSFVNATKAIKDKGFCWDCVGLIKGILWDWSGNFNLPYGGAIYGSNGVPDEDCDTMFSKCTGASTNFSNITVGEVVWLPGHIGIYVGSGLAVECTPSFAGGVQVTAVGNIGDKNGYSKRNWLRHGKLPYITYTKQSTSTSNNTQSPTNVAYAQHFDKSLARTYTIVANGGLNVRKNAGTQYERIETLPNGSRVICYGYYSFDSSKTKWYLIVAQDGTSGFVCSSYLK